MGLPKPSSKFTVDEYLEIERAAEDCHEFLDGEIFAMAGESPEHGDITANTSAQLVIQLKGTPCRARIKDTKIRSGPFPKGTKSRSGLYSYPDVVVICGEPEYHDAFEDVVINPTAIVEVLSESTELFDRGEKFNRYQTWNPTLQDYLLVAQDRPQVEHYVRQPDGEWSYRRHVGLDAVVTIASIRCTLRLADVYDRVKFEGS